MPENTLKLGIIGGALDSAIGRSHHIASQMDGRFRIVAGCFSLIPKVNEDTAALLDVPADRLYSDWHTFLKSEQGKLDAVLLLTPTPMHAEMAAEALAAEGLSVGVADLRYLAPVDTALLAELVGASGRAVLHGVPEGLVSAVVAAAFLRLESPPLTVPLGGALAPAVRASVHF